MKAYIPGTKERRERLARLGLSKRLGDHETLVQIEYEDGTEVFKPADWDAEIGAWITEDDQRFYVKGEGRSQGFLWGVPVVHAEANEAGVVSAEAAKFAAREESNEYVDEDGHELEVEQVDDEGNVTHVSYANPDEAGDEAVAADGGVMEVGSEIDLNYDFGAPEGGDGEVLDRRKVGLFDPFPVSRQEADQAVSIAENVNRDESKIAKYILIGLAAGVGIILLIWVLNWLMGTIGGSAGGGGGGGGGGGSEQLAAHAKFALQAAGVI
jgi:hypothetical protein